MQIEDGFTVTDGDVATLAEITVAVESGGSREIAARSTSRQAQISARDAHASARDAANGVPGAMSEAAGRI